MNDHHYDPVDNINPFEVLDDYPLAPMRVSWCYQDRYKNTINKRRRDMKTLKRRLSSIAPGKADLDCCLRLKPRCAASYISVTFQE